MTIDLNATIKNIWKNIDHNKIQKQLKHILHNIYIQFGVLYKQPPYQVQFDEKERHKLLLGESWLLSNEVNLIAMLCELAMAMIIKLNAWLNIQLKIKSL